MSSDKFIQEWFSNQKRSVTGYEVNQVNKILKELVERKKDGLNLWEPLPFQERYHKSTCKETMIMAGNQVGKSIAAFVEDARAVLGEDPYDKYPKKNGTLVCVGLDVPFIGRNIHRYLFRPGAFSIIRDLETGDYRTFKPWLPEDAKRIEDSIPAPPLIPERMIEDTVWQSRKANIFDTVYLKTGWQIYAFSSNSEPQSGFQADIVHIDEDIHDGWYSEMIARLSMRKGKMRISSLPYIKNDAIIQVYHRAKDEEGDEDPSTEVIQATVYDNPFMDEQTKQENIKRWKAQGEDVYRMRALGEPTTDSILMYPTFSVHQHSAIKHLSPTQREEELQGIKHRTETQRTITERNGEPPTDWCRYMVVDPGWSVCAVTFYAVPPKGNQKVMYKELYIRNCDAEKFGVTVEKAIGNYQFEEFIIDGQGGRLRDLGSGKLPREMYEEQLAKRGLKSRVSGSGFTEGVNIIEARVAATREWLSTQEDGSTVLLIVVEACPNIIREFQRYKKQMAANGYISDKGNARSTTHSIDTLEYAAFHGLKYVKPHNIQEESTVVKNRKMRADREKLKNKMDSMLGGYSSNVGINLGPRGIE